MGRSLGVRLAGSAALVFCLAGNATAQYFGRNKVQYDRADVRVLATDHFDIYYAHEDAPAALIAARLAERWYTRLSRVFEHALTGRQPVVLYGSHRRFEQTNVHGGLVDESTGGFTEARKRRIVLPFAGSLAETDHVLGHEIVHAFQFDIADRYRRSLSVPLWFIEGMAEYLTLGPGDPQTAMWMRDAVRSAKLPSIAELASGRYFPYRWGAALWSHLVSEYGEDLPARALRARGDVKRRLHELTGRSLDELSAGWQASLRDTYASAHAAAEEPTPLISSREGGARLNLAASLSPDGSRLIFLSERDQFSVDLYLADARTGRTMRKLITTAANADFESLQYLHSVGEWDRSGSRFAIATIRKGRPSLLLLDVDRPSATREFQLPQVDEVYSPTWSPAGTVVAFSAMKRGVTDLFALDLGTGALRQLTDDAYADLQPAWSPDGRIIAFATDRFTTNLGRLQFGAFRLGLLDVSTGAIAAGPALDGANHLNPAWTPAGSDLYFVADAGGASNIFRVDLASGRVWQVTDVLTGVSGITRSSPVLSVASLDGALAFSVFRRSGYEVHRLAAADALGGRVVAQASTLAVAAPHDEDHSGGGIQPVPPLPAAPLSARFNHPPYRPKLSLEAIGSPYFSAGGGPLGGYISGGASLLFGDLLRDQQLMTMAYVSSRIDEPAFGALYVNRRSRWSWGVMVEQIPELRLRTNGIRLDPERDTMLTRERERSLWTNRSLGGFAAYPLNRSKRIEVSAAFRHIAFERERRTELVSRRSGMIVEHHTEPLPSEPSVGLAEAGLALIGDTAIFGATGPMLGSRYRFQTSATTGGLAYLTILADYRRYVMPLRPFTLAVRVVHSGRYGRDAEDFRLRDAYVGSPTLVRGYGAAAVARSECPAGIADCPALNSLLASRFAAAKLELRVPVWSTVTTTSRIRYGPLPMDAFLFADAGAGWGGERRFGPGGSDGTVVRSVGAGVRVNAGGMIVEVAALRPLDLKQRGWTYAVNLRPGF